VEIELQIPALDEDTVDLLPETSAPIRIVIPRAILEVVVENNAIPIHTHPAPMPVKI
jgi:hypothetical protein